MSEQQPKRREQPLTGVPTSPPETLENKNDATTGPAQVDAQSSALGKSEDPKVNGP